MQPKMVVSVTSPALDRVSMDVRRYAETRDESLIRELPGKSAARYYLRPLSLSALQSAERVGGGVNALAVYFMFGVERIDLPGGSELRPTRQLSTDGKDMLVWSQEQLDSLLLRFGAQRFEEIGGVIARLAQVGESEDSYEGNGEGGGVSFTLPPLSLLALGQIERQLAALSQKESATGS